MKLGSTGSFNYINNYLYHHNSVKLKNCFLYPSANDEDAVRIPYVHFSAADTQIFLQALGTALSAHAGNTQIRIYMAIFGDIPSTGAFFYPILQIYTGDDTGNGPKLTVGEFTTLPSTFEGYPMTEKPTKSNTLTLETATKDSNAPAGSTELTDAQKTNFVNHYKNYSNLAGIFKTESGELVQHYSYAKADSQDIHQKASSMNSPILRCVMGANPDTSDHPVQFRPILELVDTNPVTADVEERSGDGGSTYWDFSTPCPPNCNKS